MRSLIRHPRRMWQVLSVVLRYGVLPGLGFNRATAEDERGRDLAVGPPRDEQAEHLDLAVGEGGGAMRRELPRWGATQRTRRRDRQGEGHRVLEAEVVPGGL